MTRISSRGVVIAATVGLVLAAAGPAAGHDDGVERRGSCSGSATWKLKAKPDDGRLEVEGEVDSNHRGQRWKWRILHDGWVSYHGAGTTRGSSGSFEIERRVVDSPGNDRIGWRATNPRTGQKCRGSVVI